MYEQTVANATQAYVRYAEGAKAAFRVRHTQECMDAAAGFREDFRRSYGQREYLTTLYFYAQDGSLFRTVPPAGVRSLAGKDSAEVDSARKVFHTSEPDSLKIRVPKHELSLAMNYVYNSLGQLTESTSPDGDTVRTWFDRLGRAVLSRDKRQEAAGEYEYVLFDGLNRPVESGWVSGRFRRDSLGEFNDFSGTNSHLRYELLAERVPDGVRREVTRSYWDNDRFGAGIGLKQHNLMRRAVSTVYYAEILDTANYYDYEHAVHYSYDVHGNVDTLISDAPKLRLGNDIWRGLKVINYDYDLISGKVNKVEYNKGKPDEYYHRYIYDGDNRLIEAYSSRNGFMWERDARYFYYLHGPLARTETGEHQIQGTDYIYTLQGWLKGVNSGALRANCDAGRDGFSGLDGGSGVRMYIPGVNLHGSMARDVFGYSLKYYNERIGTSDTLRDYRAVGRPHLGANPSHYFEIGGYDGMSTSNFMNVSPSLYNGNISGMVTAIDFRHKYVAADTTMGYAYHYDQLNRIAGMDVYKNVNKVGGANHWKFDGSLGTVTFTNGVLEGLSLTKGYQTGYKYDANGNILEMYRNGNVNFGSGMGLPDYRMDVLRYNYVGKGNKLSWVDDTVGKNRYAEDLDDQDSLNYQYDEIGQLVSDRSKGILKIEWNRFNKPVKVKQLRKPTISYGYDGGGNKVYRKIGDRETYYVRDGSGNCLSLYERSEFGDTIGDQFLDYYREQFLYEVMLDGAEPDPFTWNWVCGAYVDTFFKRYVTKECLSGDSLAAVLAMKMAFCQGQSWYVWAEAPVHFDMSCLGQRIYEHGLYNTDTSALAGLLGNRYKRLVRSEAYLYGSSRLGYDTEEIVLGDSLEKRRCLYNPLCGLWQKVGNVDTSKQKFAVYNDSLVRYHVSGHKRYEFANHLGNVLAVTSDRKIGVDTLSGTKLDFYYADLYSVSDYDPFGMVQPGRSWNRKEWYRYSFNGKEDESWGVQDYGFRHYDPLIARFISVDPLKDEYPFYTPYQFAGNTPIQAIDLDGLEPWFTNTPDANLGTTGSVINGPYSQDFASSRQMYSTPEQAFSAAPLQSQLTGMTYPTPAGQVNRNLAVDVAGDTQIPSFGNGNTSQRGVTCAQCAGNPVMNDRPVSTPLYDVTVSGTDPNGNISMQLFYGERNNGPEVNRPTDNQIKFGALRLNETENYNGFGNNSFGVFEPTERGRSIFLSKRIPASPSPVPHTYPLAIAADPAGTANNRFAQFTNQIFNLQGANVPVLNPGVTVVIIPFPVRFQAAQSPPPRRR